MSSSFEHQQHSQILAELKAIKALLAEIGMQKMGAVSAAAALAPPPPPQQLPPASPRDEFIALLRANKVVEAEGYFNGCPEADRRLWAKFPADLIFPNARLFAQACRLGLVDLETTAEKNLQRIFYHSLLPEDRAWFKNCITPTTAARLRHLKMVHGENANMTPMVEFLCTKPCCLERMQFAWELVDTDGSAVFPAQEFWLHTDFLRGDVSNPAYVRWWVKNVMA